MPPFLVHGDFALPNGQPPRPPTTYTVSSQEPQPETPGDDALRASFNQQWLAQETRLQTYKTRVSELERAAEEAKKKHDSSMADLRASFDIQWTAFKAEMDSKMQSYKTQVSQLESAAKEARRTSAQSKIPKLSSSPRASHVAPAVFRQAELDQTVELQRLQTTAANQTARLGELEATVKSKDARYRDLLERYLNLRGTFRTMVRIRGPETTCTFFTVTTSDDSDTETLTIQAPSTGISAPQQHPFHLDKVFLPATTDRQVYDELAPLLETARNGASVVVLAYGRSGTGKSKTIHGLLEHVADTADVALSVTELYLDSFVDLLPRSSATASKVDLNIDGKKRQLITPHSAGANFVPVTSPAHLTLLLSSADEKREVAATKVNETSSRSHAFYTLQFSPPPAPPPPPSTVPLTDDATPDPGTVTFIDLAGHERAAADGDPEQARSINENLAGLNAALAKWNDRREKEEEQERNLYKRKAGGPKKPAAKMVRGSPEGVWMEGSNRSGLLAKIVGGLMVAQTGQKKKKEGVKSKIVFLATVDLRTAEGVAGSLATLGDLEKATGGG